MEVPPWVWWTFGCGFIGLLFVDGLGRRKGTALSLREAGLWTAWWVALALGFGIVMLLWRGAGPAGEYFTGYLIEYSLSVDNMFVFALIFSYFAVPAEQQSRALFWGIALALVLRAALIFAGAALLHEFHWIIYVFGAFLVVTGVRMVRHTGEVEPERNPMLKIVRRALPMTDTYDGDKFLTRASGRLAATPMVAVLATIAPVDLVFALDSIPAIFAVTQDTFIVLTSNAFALLGLRSLYFMLAGVMERFTYLKYGLAAILVFVGLKMISEDILEVPVWASLCFIALTLFVTIAISLKRTASKDEREVEKAG
jgi:tellurite resistance protein TerC